MVLSAYNEWMLTMRKGEGFVSNFLCSYIAKSQLFQCWRLISEYCIVPFETQYKSCHLKRSLWAYSRCADSDHLAHRHGPISTSSLLWFIYSLIHSAVSNDSVSGQRRPRSDCADAQSDLGLLCPHMYRRHIFSWRWSDVTWLQAEQLYRTCWKSQISLHSDITVKQSDYSWY